MLRSAISLLAISCFSFSVTAQTKGVFPFTGMKYFKEGVWAKQVELKIDGAHLLSNRIPLNREVVINLVQPTGITNEKSKLYAAAELVILSSNGNVLFRDLNVLKMTAASGIPATTNLTIPVKFMIDVNVVKSSPTCIVQLRFYDLKGKNQLRLEMPVAIARAGEQLQLSKTYNTVKANDGSVVGINGVKFKSIVVSVDTTIKVAPKMAYTSLDISTINGSTIAEIFGGKESFWVYDKDLNEIKIKDILLKQAKGAMENNLVDYTLKIPYRLKTMADQGYTIRFRWESEDKRKVIDVVTVK